MQENESRNEKELNMAEQVFFTETQRFRKPWLWGLLVGLNACFFYGYYRQAVLGEPFGQNPVSTPVLFILCLGMVLLSVFVLLIRLETKITNEGIFVRFFPFQLARQVVFWEQLEDCYVRQYAPFKEFGGFGKRGTAYDRALNIAGNQGLQLVFYNGAKLLIGTQNPEQLSAVIENVYRKESSNREETMFNPGNS